MKKELYFPESPFGLVKKLKSELELEMVFPLIQELRSHLEWSQFLSLYKMAHERDGYEMVAIFDREKPETPLALMGYRILYDFVHGKHLYIDDLVVSSSCRSQGLGSWLLSLAEKICLHFQCTQLRLCTGIDNKLGMKFYENNHWKMRSVVYKKKF